MLARHATIDDGREYALYLAWFGPGLTKIGLTATERGTDRLAEQGALAFTWLAHGNLPAIRAAEQRISASGLAPERRQRRVKAGYGVALRALVAELGAAIPVAVLDQETMARPCHRHRAPRCRVQTGPAAIDPAAAGIHRARPW